MAPSPLPHPVLSPSLRCLEHFSSSLPTPLHTSPVPHVHTAARQNILRGGSDPVPHLHWLHLNFKVLNDLAPAASLTSPATPLPTGDCSPAPSASWHFPSSPSPWQPSPLCVIPSAFNTLYCTFLGTGSFLFFTSKRLFPSPVHLIQNRFPSISSLNNLLSFVPFPQSALVLFVYYSIIQPRNRLEPWWRHVSCVGEFYVSTWLDHGLTDW